MSISVFFRFFNIIIFFSIVIYLIRKKFSGVIAQKVQEKDLEFELLIKKQKEIIQRTENIKITIAQEQEFMKKLKRNIDQWQKACSLKQQEIHNNHAMQLRALEEKTYEQLRKESEAFLQKKVVMQAVAEAKSVLENKFHDMQEQQRYLNAVVERVGHHEHRTR